ncbi:BrnA antitoxin family protein [Propionivibrio sp.]|uniref:BrnA antitoxin family protein n=1 Tax=Propionivibrio sp. TaxID=2212460 RepID=UPI003BF12B1C
MKNDDLTDFERGLLESIGQMKRGEFAEVHTPESITARLARPVASVQKSTKRPTTLRLDEAALARWRASGKGWQTRAAELLAKHAP